MHETLVKYFNSYATISLNEGDIELIRSTFIPKRFRKRQYFLQEGEVCKFGAFIVRGAMRKYSVDEKGEEHIVELLIENWWANDRESQINEIPSKYFIDCWEDTDALLTTKQGMSDLADRIPALKEWMIKLGERYQIASQKRLHDAISLTARQRYQELEKTHPEFIRRFPQHIIASYLGINKDTLSRVRSQTAKK